MSIILSKWHIIKEVLKLRILQHALEEQSRVPKPDFMCTFHPQRHIIRLWSTVREANCYNPTLFFLLPTDPTPLATTPAAKPLPVLPLLPPSDLSKDLTI